MPGYGTMCTVPLLYGPSQWRTGKCSQRPAHCIVRECIANCVSELSILNYVCILNIFSPYTGMLVMIRVVPMSWSKVLSSACEGSSFAT